MAAGLNEAQLAAVNAAPGPMLVLAGAGSGKTRVLTHRIAHMIREGWAMPGEILALTFTNKAARVMKERVEKLVEAEGIPAQDLWVSTFHSMGAKLLRIYGTRIGLDPGFTIFDDSDQLSLIKECMELLGLSDKVISPRAIQNKINSLKNDALDPKDFSPSPQQFLDHKMAPVIRLYDEGLRKNNAVDFGDLIFMTYKLFRDDAEFRDLFQDRYRFVLVDEYQDTNASQYRLLRLMTEKYRQLCVVGDEDQSIYAWRGADIRNILEFERDFPDARVVKLEENYRSSSMILRAANRVIANNTQRKEKTLFTSQGEGEPVEVHHHENDFEEARWIGTRIQELGRQGFDLSEMAIFYRTNAQSRLLEDRLRYDRIPYKIFGGLKFYDRAEIKDALAYIRLVANPRDEISLRRIINVPTRGIGRTTLDAVREFGAKEQLPFLEALGLAAKGETEIGSGPRKKIQSFLELVAKLQLENTKMSPVEFFGFLLDHTGYLKMLQNENTLESSARIENLKELGTVLSEYESRNDEPTLIGFLEEISLMTDMDKEILDKHFVSMMTIHASKGLEFPVVFVAGCEEELFPSIKPDVYGETDKDKLEEERRLCYVAITRAEKHLHMTSAKMRRVFGTPQIRHPSRFLAELPQDEIRIVDHAMRQRPTAFVGRRQFEDFGDASFADTSSGDDFGGAFENSSGLGADGFGVGVRVSHPDFGEGKVIRREGQAEGLKVTVNFSRVGQKKFVVRFAPLQVLG